MFSIFSLGLYSLMGVAAMVALYFLMYGARCVDSGMKRQPISTDRVAAYVVIAVILGFIAGSFILGLVELKDDCSQSGRSLGACLIQQVSQ